MFSHFRKVVSFLLSVKENCKKYQESHQFFPLLSRQIGSHLFYCNLSLSRDTFIAAICTGNEQVVYSGYCHASPGVQKIGIMGINYIGQIAFRRKFGFEEYTKSVLLSKGWTVLCPIVQWLDSAVPNCPIVGQCCIQLQ